MWVSSRISPCGLKMFIYKQEWTNIYKYSLKNNNKEIDCSRIFGVPCPYLFRTLYETNVVITQGPIYVNIVFISTF